MSITTLEDFKRKCQTLFTDFVGEWYLNTMHNHKLPTKNQRLNNKQQVEEDKLKGEFKVVCDRFKGCKLQVNRVNLEYAVPLKRDTKNIPFCMYYNKLFKKYVSHNNN